MRFGTHLIFHKGLRRAVFILNKVRPVNSDEFRIRGCYFLPKVVDSGVANLSMKEVTSSRTSVLSRHTYVTTTRICKIIDNKFYKN